MEAIVKASEAEIIARDYVCATCWGMLQVVNYDWRTKTAEPKCMKENCTGAGFVTKHYAEEERVKSRMQYQDFIHVSGEVIGKKKLSKEERDELIKKIYG